MATTAINQPRMDVADPAIQLSDMFPGVQSTPAPPEAGASAAENGHVAVAVDAALGGARGVMMALGLQGALALCVCSFWLLWHAIR